MSAVLNPQPQVFESVDYFDRRTVGANVTRWVWFPGDLIVPQRKAEIDWLAVGGEETPNACLQRYGRGFVPRGRAAILEMGGEPIPMRHLGDLQAVAWTGIPLNDNIVKNKFGFVPIYPGDGLRTLRRYALNDNGMRKGMDELTSLQGQSWDACHNGTYNPETQALIDDGDGLLDLIERAEFRDGMESTLRGLEDQVRYAQLPDVLNGVDISKMKDEKLRMCNDYRNWAREKVSFMHGLLKTGHVGEWQGWLVVLLFPIVEMLLEQLEIPRQDQPLQEMSKMVNSLVHNQNQASQAQGMSAADMEMFERRMDAKLAQAREADKARIAELEQQVAAKNRKKNTTPDEEE